jgi:crotonobetainyl-CoA:carnitine CoA-transferase CaiB-like acyl-CoA transferase
MVEYALSDVKVLDVTQRIAGPYCTKLLSSFGAEVIKIEEPGEGDETRKMAPFFEDEPHPEKSGAFLYLNTSKKSITLNLKNETGTKIFKDLVKDADIVVESFEPGVMAELGLSYEELSEINPRLIMTSISNFGQTGPYRNYKATNLIAFGLSGAMYFTRELGREPIMIGGSQAEYIGGVFSFISTMIALLNRAVTNIGRWVDVSIVECVASTLTTVFTKYSYMGMIPKVSSHVIHGFPIDNYPCKDGYVNLTPGLGGAPNMALLIEKPELQDDPLFARPRVRQERPKDFEALLLPWLKEHNKQEVVELAQELRLAFAPVLNSAELLDDAQLKAREFFVKVEHPIVGELTYPGAPAKLSETPWQMGRAPLLGEHNEEIYCGQLSYAKEDLVKLREWGVI